MDIRTWLVLGVAGIAIVAAAHLPAIPQDQAYHRFADGRTLMGLQNALNVLSNIPLIWVGGLGIRLLRPLSSARAGEGSLRFQYLGFFSGIFLTGFGSAYYHHSPGDGTLLWDRLPMAIAFMSFFASVISECIDLRWGARLFLPLNLLGLGAVLCWAWTTRMGHGDLRPYGVVQFLPVLLIPLILWLYRPEQQYLEGILSMMGWYLLAKLLEHFDGQVFQWLGILSGHTLKHIAAAMAAYIVYRMLQRRARAAIHASMSD